MAEAAEPEDEIVFEPPPPARGSSVKNDWATHLQPLVNNPSKWAKIKRFVEVSPERQVREVSKGGPYVIVQRYPSDPAHPTAEQPVSEQVISTHDTEAAARDALMQTGGPGADLFDPKKSSQRAGTLASGIRSANRGEAGSLRLQDGGWDALSRGNRVWAVFHPDGIDLETGKPFVPHASRKPRKPTTARQALIAEARREESQPDPGPEAPEPNGSAQALAEAGQVEAIAAEGTEADPVGPDPVAVAAANSAPAFADEDPEEAAWK